MNETITKDIEFKDLIHVIRGQQVMLDSDLAGLYNYEVKNLNKQVNRNIEKFPEDFMFRLTLEEAKVLRFQNGTLNKRGNHIKYAPYVFTEMGVYMLATILRGGVATQQSIYIIRSFSEMKHYITENQSLLNNTDLLKLSSTVMQHTEDIQDIKSDIHKVMDNFLDDTKIKEIVILDGRKFDAAEAYIKIYKQAKHTIHIVDNYINIDTLSLLKHKQIMYLSYSIQRIKDMINYID